MRQKILAQTSYEAASEKAPRRSLIFGRTRFDLVNEGSRIFRAIRFRVECLTKFDRLLKYSLSFIAAYPASAPSRDYIE